MTAVILSRTMRIKLWIADHLFHMVEPVTRSLGLGRCKFYQQVMARHLDWRADWRITEALDALYSCEELAAVDPVLDELAREALAWSEWE
jgi:hypothetical protein